jgi:hypothetical protein
LRRLTEGSASSRLWDKEGLRAVVAQLAQSARAAKLSGRLDEPKQLAVSGPPEDQAQLQQAAAQVFQDLLGALQGWSYQKDGLLVTPSYDDAVARVADATKKLSTLDVAEATRQVKKRRLELAQVYAYPPVEGLFQLQKTAIGDYQLTLQLKNATVSLAPQSYRFCDPAFLERLGARSAALRLWQKAWGLAALLLLALALAWAAFTLAQARRLRAELPGSPARVEAQLAQGQYRAARRTLRLFLPQAQQAPATLAALGALDDQLNLLCPGGSLAAAERAWRDLQLLKEAWAQQPGRLDAEHERLLEQACVALRHPELERMRQENRRRQRDDQAQRGWEDESRRLEALIAQGALDQARRGLERVDLASAPAGQRAEHAALSARWQQAQAGLDALAARAQEAVAGRQAAVALGLLAHAQGAYDALPPGFDGALRLQQAQGLGPLLLRPETVGRPLTLVLKQQAVLGRAGSPGLDLALDDPRISGQHLKLTLAGGRFVAEDLGSTNGTQARGEAMQGPVYLEQGDILTLGKSCAFTVHLALDAPKRRLQAVWLEGKDGDILFLPEGGSYPFSFRSSGLSLERPGPWSFRREGGLVLLDGPGVKEVLLPGLTLGERGLSYRVTGPEAA